jgi:serine protease Do
MRLGGRARLGVQLVEATPELREHFGSDREAGVLVSKVIKGMPAEHAGVKVGDMIVAIDDEPIESVSDLREALADRQGETFGIEVIRDGERVRLEVSLPTEDEEDDSAGPRAFVVPPLPPVAPRPALAPVPRPVRVAPPAAPRAPLPPPLAV